MIKAVRKISVNYEGTNVTLQDLCYKPIPGVCLIQSLTDSWEDEDDFHYDSRWNETFVRCLLQPTNPACVFDKRAPMFSNLVVGGVPISDEGYPDYVHSEALIVTFLLDNSLNATRNKRAEAWEAQLRVQMAEWRKTFTDVKVSYLTESSLEIELNRESTANALAIIISYFVMLLYVTASLGHWTLRPGRFFVDSRFLLGFVGIIIVISSLVISVSIFTALHVVPTLIIAEVIPFLVLAIGVDNIFILIHTFDRQSPNLRIEERAARTLGKVGPSICLCAITET